MNLDEIKSLMASKNVPVEVIEAVAGEITTRDNLAALTASEKQQAAQTANENKQLQSQNADLKKQISQAAETVSAFGLATSRIGNMPEVIQRLASALYGSASNWPDFVTEVLQLAPQVTPQS